MVTRAVYAKRKKEIENGDFEPEWRPSPQVNLIIVVLVVLSLMAALDATVLVPALSVSFRQMCVLQRVQN